VQKLLEKELIIISGRNEKAPGQPLLYSTSKSFMDYFGINTADDLPRIREVLAEQLVEPTVMKEVNIADDTKAEDGDETVALAVTDDGELILSKEQGEGDES
jgi:segregation and condensation protein B